MQDSQSRNEQLKRRYARLWRRGLVISLVVHLALFLLFRSDRFPSPFSAAGPRAGDDRAAAGGGLRAVAIFTPPRLEPIIPPPEPIISPELLMELEKLEPEVQPVTSLLQGLAGDQPGLEVGPGLEEGEGKGDGGTAEEGRFRVIPPSPRGLILPPSDRPKNMRGREVEVWVFVTETGRVVADSTRLRPSTGNPSFDSRLRRQAAEWIFEPARRGGRPVAEWFRYEITL